LKDIVEACRLADGLEVRKLRHLKCSSCGARFFDDEAMHAIQSARAARAPAALSKQSTVGRKPPRYSNKTLQRTLSRR